MSNTTHSNPTHAQILGQEIREVRKARGLTLSELSTQVQCSVAYLSRVERGTTNISVELLNQLGRALNVNDSWFFPSQNGDGPLERQHIVRAHATRPLSEMYTRSTEELGLTDELLSSTISGDCYLLLTCVAPGRETPRQPNEPYVSRANNTVS